MGRPAKPTALHDVTGSYQKHPERRRERKGEPTPRLGIGKPPRRNASADWHRCWNELVSNVCPGVLGNSDRVWLERAAKLLAKSRDPDATFTGTDEARLMRYLSHMGMSPVDRIKLAENIPGGGGGEPPDSTPPSDPYA